MVGKPFLEFRGTLSDYLFKSAVKIGQALKTAGKTSLADGASLEQHALGLANAVLVHKVGERTARILFKIAAKGSWAQVTEVRHLGQADFSVVLLIQKSIDIAQALLFLLVVFGLIGCFVQQLKLLALGEEFQKSHHFHKKVKGFQGVEGFHGLAHVALGTAIKGDAVFGEL